MDPEGFFLEYRFQFQIGAIGSNPLKPCDLHVQRFQFQIGAIGRTSPVNIIFPVTGFQFQIGAIGRREMPDPTQAYRSFNSRLVRLVADSKVGR